MRGSKVIFSLIFSIFIFSIVSAVEIEIKDNVKLGENFIVKFSGTFTKEIQENQIKFYRQGYMPTEMGEINLIRIGTDYYFYLMVPLEKKSDMYKMVIEDAQYKSGTKTITADLETMFEIKNETAPFSINPPLVISSEEYSVQVQNLLDESIIIDLEKKIQVLEENETHQNETEEESSFFDILFGRNKEANETEIIEEENNSVMTGQVVSAEPIYLKPGETKFLTFSPPESGTIEKLELYHENEAYAALVYNPQEIKVIVDSDNEIKNETQNESSSNESNQTSNNLVELNETEETNYTNIEVIENGSIINKTTNQTIGSIYLTCKENNGELCAGDEKCLNNEKVQSKEGYCCLTECIQIKKTSTGKVIGWIIIGVILLFLAWFFKQKYSQAGQAPINLLKIASGKK